jgi:hypothetical protein
MLQVLTNGALIDGTVAPARQATPALEIEPGKLADLIGVDGDPLQDVSPFRNGTRVQPVMKDGQVYKNALPAGLSAGAPAGSLVPAGGKRLTFSTSVFKGVRE